MIKGLKELGKTVVLTTHYMEEAEFLADRIAIMRRGEIVTIGKPSALNAGSTVGTLVRFTIPAGISLEVLGAEIGVPLETERDSVFFR